MNMHQECSHQTLQNRDQADNLNIMIFQLLESHQESSKNAD
jgi:hypothetical protein